MAEREVSGIDQEACFLPRLATHGCASRLAPIDVSGDDAVVAVFVPRVLPSEQEHLLVLEEEKVCLRDQFEKFHRSLRCAARPVSAAAESRRLYAVVRRAIENYRAAEIIAVVMVNSQISSRSLPTITSPRKCTRAASIHI